MATDWACAPFVRLFKKDTDDDLCLSWEARFVWYEFLKQCDDDGIMELRKGVQGMAKKLRAPLDAVERGLAELIEDGRLRRSVNPVGFVARNYYPANYTPRSDRARQSDARARRRELALNGTATPVADVQGGISERHVNGDSVTLRDETSRRVTQISDHRSQISDTHSARARAISLGWQPNEDAKRIAAELGLLAQLDEIATEFRRYWVKDGRSRPDWDDTFENRLRSQAKKRTREQKAEELRQLDELTPSASEQAHGSEGNV